MPDRNTIRKVVNIILVIAVAGSWFAILFFSFGPLYGYLAMLRGGNLFMHLLTPVISVAEMILLSDAVFSRKDNRLILSVICVIIWKNEVISVQI